MLCEIYTSFERKSVIPFVNNTDSKVEGAWAEASCDKVKTNWTVLSEVEEVRRRQQTPSPEHQETTCSLTGVLSLGIRFQYSF